MAVKTINATQLKCAIFNSAWRAKWIGGENPAPFAPATPRATVVHGVLFHKLADQFVKWLAANGGDTGKKTEALASGDQLWEQMWDCFASTEIDSLLASSPLPSVLHLKECLRNFCGNLADLRAEKRDFREWNDLFVVSEFSADDVRFRFGDEDIYVGGRVDAVRKEARRGLVIVDYKLAKGDSLKQDMMQLAIYCALLKSKKPGLDFNGLLEYYEPKLHAVPIECAELQSLFDELVLPVLRDLAVGEITETRESPFDKETASAQGENEFEMSGKKIVECYDSFRLKVEVLDWKEAPQVVRFRLKPSPGVKIVSLANRSEDLQVALELERPPVIGVEKGSVVVDLPKAKPDVVYWRDVVKDEKMKTRRGNMVIPIGLDVDNRLLVSDFADPNTCHALVAGGTGSGKSEFLKSLVATLIRNNSPDTLRITLIDPKILTFGPLKESSFLTGPIVTDLSEAIQSLENAAAEMDRRYRQLSEEGYEKLGERFADGRQDIPFQVLVFDEFADLILTGGSEKKAFEALVARIAAKGRAAGVHLVLSTQRPERAVVTGLIKSNLPLKVCLRVNSSVDSGIVLGESGGQNLVGRGDLLCDRGHGVERAQGPYITKEELVALTMHRENRCIRGK